MKQINMKCYDRFRNIGTAVRDRFVNRRNILVRNRFPLPGCDDGPTNPELDFDMIHTLTFVPEQVGEGSFDIAMFQEDQNIGGVDFYWRNGLIGDWNKVEVEPIDYDITSESKTILPITSETIQIGHMYNINDNNVMTPSFSGNDNILTISITNKDLPENIGNNFLEFYAGYCISLISLGVPDISNVKEVGTFFMHSYAKGCESLVSMESPDTSNIVKTNSSFLFEYVGDCTNLNTIQLPELNSSLDGTTADFLNYLLTQCISLTTIILPSPEFYELYNINLRVPTSRLGILKGKVKNPSDLVAWQNLTVLGKILYTNQIQSPTNVEVL